MNEQPDLSIPHTDFAQAVGTALGAAMKSTDHDLLIEMKTMLGALSVSLKETMRHTDQIDTRLATIEQRIVLIEQVNAHLSDRYLTVDGPTITELKQDLRSLMDDRIAIRAEAKAFTRVWLIVSGVVNAAISTLAVYIARLIH